MSTSGTLSNYYVDSFLLHESEELVPSRYGPGALAQPARQPALGEHPDFSPCSFQSKASVFGTSWNPVHPPTANNVPAVYHPYVHHQAPVAAAPDGRYMRSWLEPMPGSLSFPGLPSSRHYGIKPEPLSARRGDCTTFDTHTLSLSDYTCGSPPADRDKQPSEGAFPENNGDCEAGGDKPPIDPKRSTLNLQRRQPQRSCHANKLHKQSGLNSASWRDTVLCGAVFQGKHTGRQPSCELATREIHPEKALSLHQAPNARTGERIFVQYVSHPGPQIRGGKTPQPH
ncbi:homeobox protein Hox-A9 isoform X1 [Notamacropus eugenii]|uniref:homeobox protein Hox-A9 isoform X1 n=1 Tax=Notamacropus eugenii TaxID=9315 RepID=UPI003B673899